MFFERVGDAVSSAVSAFTSWLKEKVSGIVKRLKNVDYIKPHLSGLGGEVIKETIQSLIPGLIAQGVAKLAMMANPVGGIVAAIKGVWDLIQFFRSNFEAMAGLASALLGILVNAANGDPGAAANAVEAALCQAIPLAIDLITRLIGINVGKRVKDIVARISKKIRGVIDKLIKKLNRTKPGQKFTQATGKKIPTFEKLERSKKVEKAKKKDTRRVREREKTRKDNKIAAAAASMGNWGTQLSDHVSDTKKAQSNKVFNVTGLTGALKGEKEGDLGVNLDNSKYVTTTSERNAQKIDHYFENRKAEKLRLVRNSKPKRNALQKRLRMAIMTRVPFCHCQASRSMKTMSRRSSLVLQNRKIRMSLQSKHSPMMLYMSLRSRHSPANM